VIQNFQWQVVNGWVSRCCGFVVQLLTCWRWQSLSINQSITTCCSLQQIHIKSKRWNLGFMQFCVKWTVKPSKVWTREKVTELDQTADSWTKDWVIYFNVNWSPSSVSRVSALIFHGTSVTLVCLLSRFLMLHKNITQRLLSLLHCNLV